MSDQRLKRALVKILPSCLLVVAGDIYWRLGDDGPAARKVIDTEWLHVCWLVEQNLSEEEHSNFRKALRWPIESKQPALTKYGEFKRLYYSASWQQRAAALCKIKGIK